MLVTAPPHMPLGSLSSTMITHSEFIARRKTCFASPSSSNSTNICLLPILLARNVLLQFAERNHAFVEPHRGSADRSMSLLGTSNSALGPPGSWDKFDWLLGYAIEWRDSDGP